jgi:hypothetical protein
VRMYLHAQGPDTPSTQAELESALGTHIRQRHKGREAVRACVCVCVCMRACVRA